MEKLGVLRVALALSLTTVLLYTLTAIALMIFPEMSYMFFQQILHGVGGTAQGTFELIYLSLKDFLAGLISCVAISFIAGGIFAFVFNHTRFARRRELFLNERSTIVSPI